ncbi:MAG: FecR domain-containing protein [Rhodospirillales bacterium]
MDKAIQTPVATNPQATAGGAPIMVPGGILLLTADYVRLGPDLLLTGRDGQQHLIPGYFAAETPADLMTGGGAVISGDLATKLAGPVAPAQYAQAAPAAAADPIGRVETIDGGVEVTRADGIKISLGQGAPVFSGDVIETGENGSVGNVLADDSTLSLAGNGRMVIDEIAYDPSSETGHATISIVQGVFSFVSGQIAKVGPDAMVLRTPVAQIGIRGTKIAGVAAAEGEENTISLLPDDDGSVGEISVSNSTGTIVLNQAGATTSLSSAFQAPPNPVIVPVAQIQKQFAKALKSLPPMPAAEQDNAAEDKPGEGEEAAAEGDVPAEGKGENLEGEAENPEGEGEQLAEGEVPLDGEGENLEAEILEGEGEIDALPPEDSDLDFADGQGPEGELNGEPGEQLAENGEQGAPEEAFQEAIAGGATVQEAFDAAARQAMEGMMAEGVSEAQAQETIDAAKDAYRQAIADGFSPKQALALAAEAAGAEVPDTLAEGFNTDPTGGGATDALASNIEGSGENLDPGSETGGDGSSGIGRDAQPIEDATGETTGDGEPVTDSGSGDYQPYDTGGLQYTTTYDYNLNIDPSPNYDYYQPSYDYNEPTVIHLSNDDPNSTQTATISAFTEVLSATTGDDSLVGGDGNTQFTMVQGSTLGGSDTVSGGLGTDEINFQSLNSMLIVFNANTMTADYANADGSVSGDITLTSVEQLYAGVGDGSLTDASGTSAELNSALSGVRLAFSSTDTGYGYIAAGSTGADTITLATGTVVGSSPMTYGSLSHTIGSDILGSIIFAGAGADNITGTSSGDIIFGGADNDTINGGGSDGDLIFAGSGDDGITVSGTATVFGGTGSDTLTLDASGVTADVYGVETVTGGSGNDAITMQSSLASGTSIDLGAGTDSLQLAAFGNFVSVQNTETVTGGGGDDITLSGAGDVTITGGGDDDVLSLGGTGTHTIDISSASFNGTDTITGFAAGASGDVLDVAGLGFNGAGASTSATTLAEILSTDTSLTSGTSVVVFDDAFYTGVDSTAAFSTQVTNFLTFLGSSGTSMTGSLSASDNLFFVIDDSTSANDISLWHWDDTSADGTIDSSEITDVGTLDNTDISTLAAANFA